MRRLAANNNNHNTKGQLGWLFGIMKNICLKRENRGLRSRPWRCQRVKQHSVCAHGWRAMSVMSKRLAEDVDEAEEAELERLEGPRAGARGRGGGRSCVSAAALRPAELTVSVNGSGEGVVQAQEEVVGARAQLVTGYGMPSTGHR